LYREIWFEKLRLPHSPPSFASLPCLLPSTLNIPPHSTHVYQLKTKSSTTNQPKNQPHNLLCEMRWGSAHHREDIIIKSCALNSECINNHNCNPLVQIFT
jgi:hypothetical protein